MGLMKEQLYKLAESTTKLPPGKFCLFFSFGTLTLAFVAANIFYNILDAFDKARVLPDHPGILIICLFLALWVGVMIMTATVIFTLGGKLIRYDLSKERLDSLKKSGLLSKTKSRIWLIGLSLLPFAQEGWLSIIRDKINEGVEVKLLIFDPNTQFANDRPSSIGAGGSNLSHDINEAIKKFKDFKAELNRDYPTVSNHFEVHLYKGNASMSCFILDDEARLGIYLAKATGLTAPEIRVTKRAADNDFFKMIEASFQETWNSSTEA
jgi:hypothetical protein